MFYSRENDPPFSPNVLQSYLWVINVSTVAAWVGLHAANELLLFYEKMPINSLAANDCWDLQQALLSDANPKGQASIPMETVPSRPHFLFRTFIKRKSTFYCWNMFFVLVSELVVWYLAVQMF